MTNRIEIFAPHENVNDDVVTIVERFAADGDFVAQDARLLLLETSKSTFEVYAPQAGFVTFLVELHADVPIEQPLCVLSDTAEAASAAVAAPSTDAPLSTSGAAPANASATAASPPSAHSPTENGHAPTSAEPRGVIAIAGSEPHSTAVPASGQRASRTAIALMEKSCVRVEDFPNLGLIRARDVLARVGHAAPVSVDVPAAPVAAPTSVSDKAQPRSKTKPAESQVPRTRKKLSRSKRTEIARLESAAASLTSQVSVLVPSRGLTSRLSADPATVGQMSSRLIFEVARLLRQFPDLNARYEPDHVAHYDEINVGYALDLGQGLKVPVFRQADRESLAEIHRRKQELILKYLDDGLTHADLDRGTFTITDMSDYRAWMFNPLVNAEQAAILGVGGELAVGDGHFVYPLILAFDHRLTEGLSATRFLQALSQRMAAHESVLERQLGGPNAAEPRGEPVCLHCRRTLSELKLLQAHLLRTAVDEGKEGLLCTICIAGW
jgi:2-oxoglutarate dehydrogenase E2 component (dihydrolipoamide succinyltransferase)